MVYTIFSYFRGVGVKIISRIFEGSKPWLQLWGKKLTQKMSEKLCKMVDSIKFLRFGLVLCCYNLGGEPLVSTPVAVLDQVN